MEKKEFSREIRRLKTIEHEFDVSNKKIGELFGVDAIAENMFLQHTGKAIEAAVDYLAELSGDKSEWIKYFCFDCDWGANPREVFYSGKEVMLDSPEKLWDVIKGI